MIDESTGVEFPDPYLWLEGSTEKVRIWQETQNLLTVQYVQDWRHLDALHKSVCTFSGAPSVAVSRFAGGRWFWMETQEESEVTLPVVGDEPFGAHRVLFDPATISKEADGSLSTWISPSPDGQTLALGVCIDGSDANTVQLFDVATGTQLSNPPP